MVVASRMVSNVFQSLNGMVQRLESDPQQSHFGPEMLSYWRQSVINFQISKYFVRQSLSGSENDEDDEDDDDGAFVIDFLALK